MLFIYNSFPKEKVDGFSLKKKKKKDGEEEEEGRKPEYAWKNPSKQSENWYHILEVNISFR